MEEQACECGANNAGQRAAALLKSERFTALMRRHHAGDHGGEVWRCKTLPEGEQSQGRNEHCPTCCKRKYQQTRSVERQSGRHRPAHADLLADWPDDAALHNHEEHTDAHEDNSDATFVERETTLSEQRERGFESAERGDSDEGHRNEAPEFARVHRLLSLLARPPVHMSFGKTEDGDASVDKRDCASHIERQIRATNR